VSTIGTRSLSVWSQDGGCETGRYMGWKSDVYYCVFRDNETSEIDAYCVQVRFLWNQDDGDYTDHHAILNDIFNVVIVSLYLSLYLFAILFLTTQVQRWISSSGWWWRCLILSQCTSCRPTFLHGWISSLSTTDSDMTIGLFQIWTAILKSECIVISDSGIGTLTFTSPKYNTYCVRQAL